ncbi:uncharacterized protein LOC141612574 [Silene latifolia]|uniref:uncharacterized protein LOC141612574 n=1 Tax=Silene latifolia TaxID=37657 RepID=UPI003D76F391
MEGYFGIDVDSVGRLGGLSFWWKKEVDCVFQSSSVHHMDFLVRGAEGEWRITGFYGWPTVSDRHLSWELLRILSRQSSLPWVCIGDFNEILFSTEMKGGSRPQRQMNSFRAAVDECGLRTVPWEGYNFSYDNGQVGECNRQSMLDRALCTIQWSDLFPYAKLFYLNREWSDHAPIRLVLNYKIQGEVKSRPFKFEQIWVGSEGCEEAVERGVEKGRGDLVTVLRECTRELQAWKKTSISRIGRDIDRKRKQLGRLNEWDREEESVRRRRKLVAEISDLRRQEEQYWRQRSRALWLRDGDKNTKFFHMRVGERKRKNFIAKLIDDEGVTRMGDEEVGVVANNYFTELFSTSNPPNDETIFQGFETRVTSDMNDMLKRDYCEDDITEALNQMHPLKALGPDGMNVLFYQSYWNTIGSTVTRTVLAVLRGELSPRDINKTNIVLIPKKKAPDKIRDFRPISLCNVVYKLISKVLANRLKQFLGDIVSVNQSAFTPGRAITDNIMIAFEIFHHMKNLKGNEGSMAIKLDMAKAYDRVEWSFLQRVLVALSFDSGWINRVMACVTTVSFAVLINGHPSREFRPSRGLRQGDPSSPYLFILCAEILSHQLRRATEIGTLHGVRISTGAPSISHLLFADDSPFFVKATGEEADVVSDILRRYEQASVEEQHRYLGLPTVVGRSKKALTDIIRDKLSKRLQGWRGKILSRAGKEVLLKAVANSLPTYVMSVFKIPENFCDELRSMMSHFWWNHEEGKRGISWVAWKKLCQPKGMGGMGFRDFKLFNLALLGKQAWRLTTEAGCLWEQVMRAKYYPNGEFMTATMGHNPSYIWRGLVEARLVLNGGMRRRIGDGTSTRIWRDAWLPGTHTGRVISPCVTGNEEMLVSELLTEGNGWDMGRVESLFLPFEVDRIVNIRVSQHRPSDIWYWRMEKDGVYTVKFAYKLLAGGDGVDVGGASDRSREMWLWKRLWRKYMLGYIFII